MDICGVNLRKCKHFHRYAFFVRNYILQSSFIFDANHFKFKVSTKESKRGESDEKSFLTAHVEHFDLDHTYPFKNGSIFLYQVWKCVSLQWIVYMPFDIRRQLGVLHDFTIFRSFQNGVKTKWRSAQTQREVEIKCEQFDLNPGENLEQFNVIYFVKNVQLPIKSILFSQDLVREWHPEISILNSHTTMYNQIYMSLNVFLFFFLCQIFSY